MGVSAWGVVNLQQGLELKDLAAENSYLQGFYHAIDTNYKDDPLLASLVINEPLDYSSGDVQAKVTDLLHRAKEQSKIDSLFQLSWLSDYMALGPPVFDNSTKAGFINNLKHIFLPSHPHYENDVKFDPNGTDIVASRVYVMLHNRNVRNSEKQMEYGEGMVELRNLASDSPLLVIAYSPLFIYLEQFLAVLPSTLQTVGIAVVAVFVVTLIFMPHPIPVFLVTLTVAMIIFGIFGFMHFWNLTLSSLTMIMIIMSVGFSVDFAAHICHAFMQSEGHTRNERTVAAINRVSGPIFNGALSTILGIVMLVFAKSYVFVAFFKVMLSVILFGLAHAVLFLPVVLSLIGPLNGNQHTLIPPKEESRSADGNQLTLMPLKEGTRSAEDTASALQKRELEFETPLVSPRLLGPEGV